MNKCFSIALITLVLASCHNSGDRKATTTTTTAPTTFTAPVVLDSNKAGVTSTPATTTNGATTAALNPAHGMPGHRCDIPEGAPLSTPASNAPAPVINSATAPTMMQTPPPPQPANPANGNARLNPAHGAPGHDCAIPVGQPLKS